MRTALADSHGCMWIYMDSRGLTQNHMESQFVAQTVMQARVRDCAAFLMVWGTTEHSEAKVAKASQDPRAFPRSVVDHRGHRVTCPVRCDSVSVGSRVRRAEPQNGAAPLTVCDGAQSAEFGTGRGEGRMARWEALPGLHGTGYFCEAESAGIVISQWSRRSGAPRGAP